MWIVATAAAVTVALFAATAALRARRRAAAEHFLSNPFAAIPQDTPPGCEAYMRGASGLWGLLRIPPFSYIDWFYDGCATLLAFVIATVARWLSTST